MLLSVPILLNEMNAIIDMLDNIVIVFIVCLNFEMEGNVVERVIDFYR